MGLISAVVRPNVPMLVASHPRAGSVDVPSWLWQAHLLSLRRRGTVGGILSTAALNLGQIRVEILNSAQEHSTRIRLGPDREGHLRGFPELPPPGLPGTSFRALDFWRSALDPRLIGGSRSPGRLLI